MKIGAEGKEVYVYKGDVANRAIQLAGMELQIFIERKEIAHTGHPELAKLSDEELLLRLMADTKRLLGVKVIEHDEV